MRVRMGVSRCPPSPAGTSIASHTIMLRRLRRGWRELKRGKPGRRFRERYERSPSTHGARKWALIGIGVLLVLVGVVFLPLPGPGLLIIAAGALLIAEESLS